MKTKVIFLLLAISAALQINAQAPAWVTQRPINNDVYTGIGIAPLSSDDYVKIATQNALSDIASQIATKVENEAFLHTVDVDGKSRQLFEDKIVSNMTAWIEGMELKDSYQNADKYYVYYTLDKELHRKNSDARRRSAINQGLDYLEKGLAAESSMNLTQAMQLYGKGLDIVEPWLFMNLSTQRNGETIDIPTELYNAYINVFSGMAITTNTVNIDDVATFKAIKLPIAACLSKNGTVLPNVKLKAEFVLGSGAVTPSITTDYNGTAEFYVTNVTAKDKIQEIRITIDDSFIESLPQSYRQLLNKEMWPTAKVTLTTSQALTAYLYINEQNDLEGIERHIGSIIANNHFTITEDPDAADCFIDLSTIMDMGETVKGAYDLNSCYCTLILKIYNNKTQELLLDYNVNRVKVLAPEHKTAEETIAMCIREVMKRVKSSLPQKIKKMNM
ncbi:MAG: LPP20 family lipoprotein [Bacteroidaceae bacterium]|nr:hypothetical protein [Bacteroidales bacterium]MBQ2877429.1 LPP20 family lipoprotein [Bacteroidaceae bacterium]MBQ3622962.1 LPP20 family lipoprotein [Bacteroidaceae bacterium]